MAHNLLDWIDFKSWLCLSVSRNIEYQKDLKSMFVSAVDDR